MLSTLLVSLHLDVSSCIFKFFTTVPEVDCHGAFKVRYLLRTFVFLVCMSLIARRGFFWNFVCVYILHICIFLTRSRRMFVSYIFDFFLALYIPVQYLLFTASLSVFCILSSNFSSSYCH